MYRRFEFDQYDVRSPSRLARDVLFDTTTRTHAITLDQHLDFCSRHVSADVSAQIFCLPHILQNAQGEHLSCLTEADYCEFAGINHPGARHRSLATRALLRRTLSKTTNNACHPSDWVFERSAQGKPIVASNCPPIYFNCSHTHYASTVAISTKGPVGLDIEDSRASFDATFVAQFVSDRELRDINSLSVEERRERLVQLWTVKEAYSKLSGTGLAQNFSELEFEFVGDGETVRPVNKRLRQSVNCKSWILNCNGRPLTAAVVTEDVI